MATTVQTQVMQEFGMSEQDYQEMVNAMRIVNHLDAVDFVYTGKATPAMQSRMLPMPNPQQIYREARSMYRLIMRDIDRHWFGYNV